MANTNPNQSIEVANSLSDSVSSLSFSPKANLLVATSWDNQVCCWEITKSGFTGNTVKAEGKTSMKHDQPVLCSTWNGDGTAVFSGGCDKQVKMWPLLSGGQPIQVAIHDAPVKDIAWIPELNVLASASWDKTVKYWDLRQPTPVHTQQLPDRCFAMSVRHPLMIVGTADKKVIAFDLKNPAVELKRIDSPLTSQTRCIATFPDKQGFLIGSIGGRVGVHHIDDKLSNKNYTFKCHRSDTGNNASLYPVNSFSFHPVHHTFASTGSDGVINFWDKDNKQRLKIMSKCNQPIPCGTFNKDGSIYAYAVCYDWSKGAVNHNPTTAKTNIFLHLPKDEEVKAKPRTGGRR